MNEDKRTAKYHHAAYAYLIIGIIYLVVSYFTMPPHDLSGVLEEYIDEYIPVAANLFKGIDYSIILNSIVVGAGLLFLGLTYFIYKEYRILTIVLAVFYGIRLILATTALFSEDTFVSVKYVLPLIVITFYMLARAAWDLR